MNDWAATNNTNARIAIKSGDERGLSGRRNMVVSISGSVVDNKHDDDRDDDDDDDEDPIL